MKDREKPMTPVDFMRDRLPLKVKRYLHFDQQASNASLPEPYRETSARKAMEMFNGSFSQMDYQALQEFIFFKAEYKRTHEPRLKIGRRNG